LSVEKKKEGGERDGYIYTFINLERALLLLIMQKVVILCCYFNTITLFDMKQSSTTKGKHYLYIHIYIIIIVSNTYLSMLKKYKIKTKENLQINKIHKHNTHTINQSLKKETNKNNMLVTWNML